ncbi:dihydrodipicolinate synthase family protein [Enterococcus sp. LJL99]
MTTYLKNLYHVAVPTAFYENEELNVNATLDHIVYLQNSGLNSVLVCGSTGEQHSLTLEEKEQLLVGIEKEPRIKPELEIIFGIASIRQKEAVTLAKRTNSSTKISSILVGFPPYILPTQEEVIRYVEAISQVCQKPIILYNHPKRTGFNLELSSLLTLVKTCPIIGLKEAGDEKRIPEFKSKLPNDFLFYVGGEKKLKEKLDLGFNRLSSIAGNLYPLEVEKWFEDLRKGNNPDPQLEGEMDKLYENSPLVYLKEQLTKKEQIQMGLPRSPLGNSEVETYD